MRAESTIDHDEAEEKHEAMDYAQHEGTYANIITLLKWSIFELAMVLIALFCFIQAGAPWLGAFFLLAGILAIPGVLLFAPRK